MVTAIKQQGESEKNAVAQPIPIMRAETRESIGLKQDRMAAKSLSESRVKLLEISRKVETDLKQGVREKLGDSKYALSVVNETANVAVHDLNSFMRIAHKGQWRDLTSEEFKLEEGKLPKGIWGIYEKGKFKVDLEDFIKDSLEPLERLHGKIQEGNATAFVYSIYQVAVHEAFHSVQENRFMMDMNKGRRSIFSGNRTGVFAEGSAKFVDRYVSTALNEGGETLENSRAAFLKDFSLWKVSQLVSEEPGKIKGKLRHFSDYDQGLFMFAVRYAANGSFTETLNEISALALNGTYKNKELYNRLERDIASGEVDKLKNMLEGKP